MAALLQYTTISRMKMANSTRALMAAGRTTNRVHLSAWLDGSGAVESRRFRRKSKEVEFRDFARRPPRADSLHTEQHGGRPRLFPHSLPDRAVVVDLSGHSREQ